MIAKIKLLTDAIANQIAAGEVVQRPASVVKELLENALDAGSKHIKLVVQDGGKTLIQVIDDGCGMNEVDACMCFRRHATSKIEKEKDLLSIHTYGFRGEAMSSISAVAEVELITRSAEEKIGTRVVIEESQVKKRETIACPVGTQIAVRYLFRKVPGRRNFLKSDNVEMRHITEAFQRVTLSRPDVAFSFLQNNTEIYQLPATKLVHRIVHLFGSSYQKKLIPCQGSSIKLELNGYIGRPNEAKKTRGGQFLFVNGRYIKSPYLQHAVKEAFEKLLPPNTFPFYVLFITLSPDQVDINVHPAKTEVKFQEERLVYVLVMTSVRKALATHRCMHTIDFEHGETKAFFRGSAAPAMPVSFSPYTKSTSPPDKNLLNTLYGSNRAISSPKEESTEVPSEATRTYRPPSDEITKQQETMLIKLQLNKKYILAQVKSGLLIVDQRAAYERILYERNKRALQQKTVSTQKLLFPYKMSLQPADMALLQGCKESLESLGFRFNNLSPTTISITGQPTTFQNLHLPTESLISGLLEQYKMYATKLSLAQEENWARSLAKRGNIPMGTVLTSKEMDSMVDQLFACENPNYTPDGEHIWRIVDMEFLQDLLADK